MASQDARLSKFEADFKQQQSKMSNKIDTLLKVINDRMTRALPSEMVKNPKLNVNPTFLVSSAHSYPMEDPQSSFHPFSSVNVIKMCFKSTNDFQKDQLQVKTLAVNKTETPKSKKHERALEDEFKDLHLKLPVLAHAPILGESKPFDSLVNLGLCVNLIPLYLFKTLNIRILEDIEKVLGLADGTKSYLVRIVKDVEVGVGKLKLLEDFYIIDMEKDPTCLLLVGRGFLVTASAVIDCKKAKIAVGEGVTRSIFGVKEIGLEIARDAKLNPFKDVLVFRKMVEFLGAIPINLKRNIWESEDLIKKKIDWKRLPKEGDGAWHIRIEMIDPDREKSNRVFQSIPTTRKLSEKEKPSDIIDLEHFHDS
ncbi:DNA-directed DNA polymerase [Tanacetum coccineum]